MQRRRHRRRVVGGGAGEELQQEAEEEVTRLGVAKRREEGEKEVEKSKKIQTEEEQKKKGEEKKKPAKGEGEKDRIGEGGEVRRRKRRGTRRPRPPCFLRREGYFLVIRPGGARRLRRYNHNAARFKTTETGHGGFIAATRSYRSPRQPRTVRQTRLHHGRAVIAEYGLR